MGNTSTLSNFLAIVHQDDSILRERPHTREGEGARGGRAWGLKAHAGKNL